MSRRRALWLVPLLLLVHNLEEALLMPRVLPLDPERVPSGLQGLLPEVTYAAFLPVLLLVTLLPFVVAARGDLSRDGSKSAFFLVGVQTVMLLNVLSHVASSLVLGAYAPGAITAVLLNLPFSLYLLHRAVRERWLSRRALSALPPLALLFHGPVLLGLMALSGWAVRLLA